MHWSRPVRLMRVVPSGWRMGRRRSVGSGRHGDTVPPQVVSAGHIGNRAWRMHIPAGIVVALRVFPHLQDGEHPAHVDVGRTAPGRRASGCCSSARACASWPISAHAGVAHRHVARAGAGGPSRRGPRARRRSCSGSPWPIWFIMWCVMWQWSAQSPGTSATNSMARVLPTCTRTVVSGLLGRRREFARRRSPSL